MTVALLASATEPGLPVNHFIFFGVLWRSERLSVGLAPAGATTDSYQLLGDAYAASEQSADAEQFDRAAIGRQLIEGLR